MAKWYIVGLVANRDGVFVKVEQPGYKEMRISLPQQNEPLTETRLREIIVEGVHRTEDFALNYRIVDKLRGEYVEA